MTIGGGDREVAEDSNEQLTAVLSQSPLMEPLLEKAAKVAKTNKSVLLLGETGVGKGLLAETIHAMSPRRQQKLILVNCGGLPPGLIESELFGHEKGAFTDAVKQRVGYFEEANGSTLFLDEIGDMSLDAQQRLLHVLAEKHLRRVGGTGSVPVDVRVIAATHRDLPRAIEDRTFREDLFQRLSVFPLVVPPLRARREDIPLLAAHFVPRHAQQPAPPLSDAALARLKGYDWPGNVRELENWIERMLILSEGKQLGLADVLEAERMGQNLSPSAWVSPVVPKAEDPCGTEAAAGILSRRLGSAWGRWNDDFPIS
ncbi:MAG: sigma-54-dependent Fis family transcriptional regulator [Gemmatimonadetes bacterium]|nr:sigma-54-dependent Fis family transcriptional regulator [Gemmatimonadota bacterium]